MLGFLVLLRVQYILNKLYIVQKQKNMLQKLLDPNYTKINLSFHNSKNGFISKNCLKICFDE